MERFDTFNDLVNWMDDTDASTSDDEYEDLTLINELNELRLREQNELNQLNELNELRLRARALGIKNIDNMNTEQLNERIAVMLKVRAEGLTRLEFDDNQELIPSVENLRILQIVAAEPKHSIRRADVLQKLQGYRLLTNKLDTNSKRWTRFINTQDGMLRAGGFPIRNKPEEEFIVLKNVSKKFTFSIKRDEVILMEKIPQDSGLLLSDTASALISEFRARPDGNQFIAVKDDFTILHSAMNNTMLAINAGINRGGLGKGFRLSKTKYKNFFLFKLSEEDKNELQTRLNALSEEDKLGNRGISPDLLHIIDRFYPN